MLYIKRSVLLTFLIYIFLVCQIRAASTTDTINYSFKNKALPEALNFLINKYNMPVLYVNKQTDTITVNADCQNCSGEQALNNLLTGTSLQWKRVNKQIIIYDTKSENIVATHELKNIKSSSIRGYIYDSITNEPLPYATIAIKGTGTGTVTNHDGYFSINNLSADKYQLNILYVGYQADSLLADLSRNENLDVQIIKLNPKNIELDAIIIRKPAIHTNATINKASVVVFDPLRLKTTPTMDQGDIVQNIRLAPGVNIIPDDPMGINLRGGSSDQTLIMFDKIPIYHTQHLMGFNGLLNANCSEGIALHSGGFSSQFGDRLSGVLNIKGRKGNSSGVNGGASANLYTVRGYLNLPVTRKLNLYTTFNKSFDVFGSSKNLLIRDDYSYFNFYDQVKYTGKYGTGFYAQGLADTDYKVDFSNFSDFTTKINYVISKKDTINLTFLYSYDQIDIRNNADTINYRSGNRSEKWNTMGVNATYYRKWTPKIESTLGTMISKFENNTGFRYAEDNFVMNDFINKNSVLQTELFLNTKYHINQHLNWLLGVEDTKIETGLTRFDLTDTISESNFTNQSTINKLTAFSELKFKPIEKIEVNIGLRSNKISDLEGFDLDPRLSVRSKFKEFFSATFAWGIYHQYIHRTPSVVAYNLSSIGPTGSWIYSQNNLAPSQAIHWLGGLNFDTKMLSLHATVYYKTYSKLHLIIPSQMQIAYIDNSDRQKRSLYIDWIKNREVIMSGNDEIDIFSGGGNSKGLELILLKNKGIYTGFISYHYSETRFLFPYMNNGNSFIPSYDHTHELKSMNYLSYYNWNVGNIIYLVSGKPYPNQYPYHSYFDANELNLEHPINWEMNTENRLPVYFNMDISVSYDIKMRGKINGTVGMVVQNVFDTKNVISKYYTWNNSVAGDPVLELKNQYSLGRLFNIFLSIDINSKKQ